MPRYVYMWTATHFIDSHGVPHSDGGADPVGSDSWAKEAAAKLVQGAFFRPFFCPNKKTDPAGRAA